MNNHSVTLEALDCHGVVLHRDNVTLDRAYDAATAMARDLELWCYGMVEVRCTGYYRTPNYYPRQGFHDPSFVTPSDRILREMRGGSWYN